VLTTYLRYPDPMRQWIEASIEAAIAYAAYYLFGWIGLAIYVVFLMVLFATQFASNQQALTKILLSRLPNRCVVCHREILDEGGVVDKDGIYHGACSDKLGALEELPREAGVKSTDAI